jgi:plastocyanin
MRASIPAIGLSLLVGVGAGYLGTDAWARDAVVSQRNRVFAVSQLEIARGDTVRFTNDDEFLHHIYIRSSDLNFDSREQAPGQTIEVRFRNAGTYDVRCRIHPKMLVVVTAR